MRKLSIILFLIIGLLISPKVWAETLTLYPTLDGYTQRTGTGTWADLHGGAGTACDSTGSGLLSFIYLDARAWPSYSGRDNLRGIFIFDRSTLPASSTINSVSLSLFSGGIQDQGEQYLVIVSHNTTSTLLLKNSDYDFSGFGATALAIKDISLLSNIDGTENIIDFNDDGVAYVSANETIKLGALMLTDYNDADIGSGVEPQFYGYYSEAGVEKSPKLVIDYTPYSVSSSTAALYYNGFSYGEIVMTIFLFLIFIILLLTFLFNILEIKIYGRR